MQVCFECPVDETGVQLFLNDVELFLVAFGGDGSKWLGYLCLTNSQDALVLEIDAEGNLYESLVAGYAQNDVVVIELSFQGLIGAHVVEQWGVVDRIGRQTWAVPVEEVKRHKDTLVVVSMVGPFLLKRYVFPLVRVQGKLVDNIPNNVIAGGYKILVNFKSWTRLSKYLIPSFSVETACSEIV